MTVEASIPFWRLDIVVGVRNWLVVRVYEIGMFRANTLAAHVNLCNLRTVATYLDHTFSPRFPDEPANMTRQKWTTKEQERWLEDRKPAFLIANQNKIASKEFFPGVVKEFRDKWPVPPVTQGEIKDAGNAELAARVKKTKYDKVRV